VEQAHQALQPPERRRLGGRPRRLVGPCIARLAVTSFWKSTITERELFVTRDPPRLVPAPQPVFANSANSTRDVVYA
jgi:hypothetical protein